MTQRYKLLWIGALVLVTVLGIWFLIPTFEDYINKLRYGSLVGSLSSEDTIKSLGFSPVLSEDELGNVTDTSIENLTPEGDIPTEELVSVLGVSTGEISYTDLNNAYTGKPLARATTLKVVSRDKNGSVEVLKVIIRVVPTEGPERDVSSFLLKYAAGIREIELPSNETATLSEDGILKIFPKGSRWYFSPLTASESYLLSEEGLFPEYLLHARFYYGDDFSEVKDYVDSGLVIGYKKPIFLESLIADSDTEFK